VCCEAEEWRKAAGVVGAETQPFYHVRPGPAVRALAVRVPRNSSAAPLRPRLQPSSFGSHGFRCCWRHVCGCAAGGRMRGSLRCAGGRTGASRHA